MNVPPNYEYELKGEDGDQLIIKGISDKTSALKWIDGFSETSLITWRTYKTYPISKLYQFKKIFRCHFNTSIIRKKDQRELPTKRYSRNTSCPVTMTFCLSQPKDGEVICTAFFKGTHNHDIDTPSALLNRPLKEETKTAALKLFSKGHLPSTAYVTHSVLLMAKLGDQFSEIECDRSILPPRCRFNLIYNNEKWGPISEEEKISNLAAYLETLNKKDCKSALSKLDDEYIVAICPLTMQRAHLLPEAQKLISLDITDHQDKMKGYCRSYIFTTYTTFGACVPLGCIITETSSLEAFQEGLRIFIEDFHLFTFSPQFVMTNGDRKLDIILSECFPGSKFLICTYHLLKNMWRFLLARKNFFPSDARQTLYYQFKRLVYARSVEEFEDGKQDLLISAEGYSQFDIYLSDLIKRRKHWAHCFLQNIAFRGHCCNHPIEIVSRLFKDIPLRNTKTFTQPQFVDFLATAFNLYYTQKCVDVAAGNVTLGNLHIPEPFSKVEETLYNIYKVTVDEAQFVVDMTAGICTCVPGRYGRLCAHQLSIIHKYNIVSEINSLDVESKTVFYHLANYKIPGSMEAQRASKEKDGEKKPLNNSMMDISEDINIAAGQISIEESNKASCAGRKKITSDCIRNAQDALQEVFAELSERLLSDPTRMVPAITKFRANFKLCTSRKPRIIAGLYAAFDEKQVEELRQARRRRRRKKLERRLLEKAQSTQQLEEPMESDIDLINNPHPDLEDEDTLSAEEFTENTKKESKEKIKNIKKTKKREKLIIIKQTKQSSSNEEIEYSNIETQVKHSNSDNKIEQSNRDNQNEQSSSDNNIKQSNSDNETEQPIEEIITLQETEQLIEMPMDDQQILQSIATGSEPVYLVIDDNGYATVLESNPEL